MKKYTLIKDRFQDKVYEELYKKVYSLLMDWKESKFMEEALKVYTEIRSKTNLEEIERFFLADLAEKISLSKEWPTYEESDYRSIPEEVLGILESTLDPIHKEDISYFLRFLDASVEEVDKERKIFYSYLFSKLHLRKIEKTKNDESYVYYYKNDSGEDMMVKNGIHYTLKKEIPF